MKIYGINTEDVVLICSKKTLTGCGSNFFEGMSKEGNVYKFSGKNYCSGVLCSDSKGATLKLMKKSSCKLFAQIKSGAVYLK